MKNWRDLWSSPEPSRPATPDDDGGPGVGALMREMRRARGLTLADVERDTRINRHYIEAMESEDFHTLPAPVYARGFMRSYARYLGIDAEEAAAAVPSDLPRPDGLEPLPGLRRTSGTGLPELRPRVIALLAGALVVAIALLWIAPDLPGGAGTPDPEREPAASDVRGAVPPFEEGEAPNMLGVHRDVALALLDELGLRPVVIESVHETVPAGEVFHQAPAPGLPVPESGVVTLFVSKGPSSARAGS